MNVLRRCYGCAGSGQRGVFKCGVCAGTGELTGAYVQAHTGTFRDGALQLPGRKRTGAPKRPPAIRVRVRRRVPPPESDGCAVGGLLSVSAGLVAGPGLVSRGRVPAAHDSIPDEGHGAQELSGTPPVNRADENGLGCVRFRA